MGKMSLAAALRHWVERDGERVAVTCGERSITRRQLDVESNRLAHEYRRLGLARGDIAALVLPNSIGFYVAAFAAYKVGAIILPLSAKMPAAELEEVIRLADPKLVHGLQGSSLGRRIGLAVDHAVSPDAASEDLEDGVAKPWFATTSGGSTGRPKVIVNTEAGEIDPEAPAFKVRAEGVAIITGPLYHGGPFVFSLRALLWGNHVVLMEKFDAQVCVERIERHRVDWLIGVPTALRRISLLGAEALSRHDISSLQEVITLGAACPQWLKEDWIDRLGPEHVHEFYSCTEKLGFTWITGTEWLLHRGSVGKPAPGTFRILSENGQDLPPGEVGEIYMLPASGPATTYYYIGAQPRRRSDGWESCGDLGWMDEDGYLYIADRRTDMIVSGGANVYPAEVETLIDQYPGVDCSAVIGLPDDDLGQRVHAIVQTSASLTADELRAHLADKLVRYKVPRTFEFTHEPLKNEAGKLRRSALRQQRLEST